MEQSIQQMSETATASYRNIDEISQLNEQLSQQVVTASVALSDRIELLRQEMRLSRHQFDPRYNRWLWKLVITIIALLLFAAISMAYFIVISGHDEAKLSSVGETKAPYSSNFEVDTDPEIGPQKRTPH